MGRPAFEPTAEQRADVAKWKEARVSIEEISRRIGKAPKTVRKVFAAELGLSLVQSVITQSGEQELLPPPPREPAFVPSLDQRTRVTILAGARISPEEIARKMEMTVDMLKEHFGQELINGPAVCKSDIIESTFYAGKGGNVAAQKVYLAFNAQAEPDAEDQPKALPPAGKKEQRLRDAQAPVGSDSPWNDLDEPGPVRH